MLFSSDAPSPTGVRGGSLVVAGMFVVGGFIRILFPSPSPVRPALQPNAASARAAVSAEESKKDAYTDQLAEKVRESFGCAGPSKITGAPQQNYWNVPAKSRGLVHFVVAFEPDPVHTHLALLFDRDVEALELAVQQSGHYVFDRSVLPWEPAARTAAKGDDSNKSPTRSPHELEKYPGLLIFRSSASPGTAVAPGSANPECPAKETLFVFLVAETPTSGVRTDQFQNALAIMRQIRAGAEQLPDAEPQPLLLLGPNFSGSLDSLRRQIEQIPSSQNVSRILAYSGTVSGAGSASAFRNAFPAGPGPIVTFESFQENDDYAIQMFAAFAASRGYCSEEIAVLSEADTVYGNQSRAPERASAAGKRKDSPCEESSEIADRADESKIVHLHFPREVSFFRSAYQKELAAQSQNSVKLPNGKSSLPVETDEEASDDDAVAPFARGQTSLSQESVMLGIASELQKHHIKFTILLATNPVDEVFLARYLRANYPQGRIVVTSPDLLLMNQDDSLLYGVLGLNDYSLVPGIGDSLCQLSPGDSIHSDQLFDSSSSVGVFNAATALLFTRSDPRSPSIVGIPVDKNASYADYGSPAAKYFPNCAPHPSVWLTILGRDGYWPIAALPDQNSTRLVGDRDPNFHPVLPVVPAQNVWDKYSSLPDIREVRIPPQDTSLHTRPAWNVTYMLCLVALALHAYLSLTGTFLSNSESKAQFARSGDRLAVAVLAIGAFWLCTFFVLLLCTRSLQIQWDTISPRAFTLLLWCPLPVFVAVTTYDLAKLRDQRSLAYSFAALTILMTAFQVLLSSNRFPALPFVWSNRLIHLTSGVSPVLPFLLLFAAGYWWSWLSLRSVSIVDLRRPRLPNICSLPRSSIRISETEGELVRTTAHPLGLRIRIAVCILGVLVVSLSALEWRHPLQSLEGNIYDIGYFVGLSLAIAVFLSCLIRLVFTWFDYKQVLSGLDRSPLREAFSRMKRLSWRSMWNPGGSTIRETYRVMSRTLESMNRLKAILMDPPRKGSPEVLEHILATEERLDDVMNDYSALVPLTCEEESFEQLLKDIDATRTKLSEAVERYAPLFPESSDIADIPFATPHHTFEHVRSAHKKVSEKWGTYRNSFEAAIQIRNAASRKSEEAQTFYLRVSSSIHKLRTKLSPSRTFQGDPNRGKEVMRQIRMAHTNLDAAVQAHDSLLAHGQPQTAISNEAHESLKKIKSAQIKLIAALDRYAALFPESGGRSARGTIMNNLTVALEELQKQLANTAGVVLTKILAPVWAVERVPSVSEDERLPKQELEMPRAIEEEFVALVYVNFLQSVLLQMRTLVICAGGMYVLVLCSMSVYPFEPHLALQILAVVLLVGMAVAVGFVYKEMHRDSILSRLTSTTAGELGWDFWLKFVSAGAIPVFSLLAVQFPEIGKFLFSWLAPALQAVK